MNSSSGHCHDAPSQLHIYAHTHNSTISLQFPIMSSDSKENVSPQVDCKFPIHSRRFPTLIGYVSAKQFHYRRPLHHPQEFCPSFPRGGKRRRPGRPPRSTSRLHRWSRRPPQVGRAHRRREDHTGASVRSKSEGEAVTSGLRTAWVVQRDNYEHDQSIIKFEICKWFIASVSTSSKHLSRI